MLESGHATVAVAAKVAKGATVSERVKRPGLATLKGILENPDGIPEDCKHLLRWIVGEIQTSTARKHLDWLTVQE